MTKPGNKKIEKITEKPRLLFVEYAMQQALQKQLALSESVKNVVEPHLQGLSNAVKQLNFPLLKTATEARHYSLLWNHGLRHFLNMTGRRHFRRQR